VTFTGDSPDSADAATSLAMVLSNAILDGKLKANAL
jgi:hypothetical protein